MKSDVAESEKSVAKAAAEEVKAKAKAAAEDVKTRAKAGKQVAADGAAHLAEEAKGVASGVVEKAKHGVSDIADRLLDTVAERKSAGVERVKRVAGAIDRAAGELDEEAPQAARYVRLAAEELRNASEAVAGRDVGDLLDVVQDFARRQPAIFIGATALAGFAVVRFLMTSGSRDERRREDDAADFGGGVAVAGNAPGWDVGDDVDTALAGDLSGSSVGMEPLVPEPIEPSSASGDPGGVSPEAPGFERARAGAGED